MAPPDLFSRLFGIERSALNRRVPKGDNVKTIALIGIVTGLVLTGLRAAAQDVPPPPKAHSGPSLEVTMKFIQGRLNDLGKVSVSLVWQDSADGSISNPDMLLTLTVTNVVADAGQCRVSYRARGGNAAGESQDKDAGFSLRDVENVVIEPLEQSMNGATRYIAIRSNPPTSALLVRLPHNNLYGFWFSDSAMADRVAKAITHAVELCGGGNHDPF
jgi:hypothetical protein